MKTLRGHILRIWVIAVVCCGLSMAATQPAQASSSSNAFANWLQSLAKNTSAPELEKKLKSLKHEKGDIHHLIEQASNIVSSNNEDFNLPDDTAADNIRHILLVEWNQFQDGNAMAAIPAAETLKPNPTPQHQKSASGSLGLSFTGAENVTSTLILLDFFCPDFLNFYRITPLISGIAIGAP